MTNSCGALCFAWTRRNLNEVLIDHALASLGDSYVNFIYSLAISNRKGSPLGTKVKGSVLAEALRKAGLRECLPSRMSRHDLADGAEALMVYAWLSRCVSLDESVAVIGRNRDPVEGLSELLTKIKRQITFP
ncbi:MAG TPA: ribonuclease III family protein [Candidatus Acidoferrales bacterium]|nr:ribonuclease III family protein [Candidatus Acidoferrales bacterium]